MKQPVRTEVIEAALKAGFVRLEEEELAPEAFGLKHIIVVILFKSASVYMQRMKHADAEKLLVKLCNLWLEGLGSSLLYKR